MISRDGAGRAERVAVRSRIDRGPADTSVDVRGDDLRQVLSRAFGARTIRSTKFDVRRTGGSSRSRDVASATASASARLARSHA